MTKYDITDEQKLKIIKLYKEGLHLEIIQQRMKIGYKRLRKIIKELNLTRENIQAGRCQNAKVPGTTLDSITNRINGKRGRRLHVQKLNSNQQNG